MAVKRFHIYMLLAVFCLLWAGLWQAQLTQTQEPQTFDDDDPTNDPNVCFDSPDPNCDWERGWFQAALNLGHISIQDAQSAYKDMHVSGWLTEEARAERIAQLALYADDDPTNDPNLCFESSDPEHCDWIAGYYGAAVEISLILTQDPGLSDPDSDISRALADTIIFLGETTEYWEERVRRNPEAYQPIEGVTSYIWTCPGDEPCVPEGVPPPPCTFDNCPPEGCPPPPPNCED